LACFAAMRVPMDLAVARVLSAWTNSTLNEE
jgi:hypothetical protein